jgi:hypothetical protein
MGAYVNGKAFMNGLTLDSLTLPNGYLGSSFGTIQGPISGATATVVNTDIIIMVASSAYGLACNVSLPSLASSFGQQVIIKDMGGNALVKNITIYPDGTETIDGALSSLPINTNMGAVTLASGGGTWINISDNS